MLFRQIFDEQLAQYAYLVGCQRTREAILVDPERDVERYQEAAKREGVRITAVTETHIHADFLSGARELATRDPKVKLYLSAEGGDGWSYRWPEADGRSWTPLRHGDSIRVGNVELRVLHTPGHTPEHLAFLIVDHGGGADEPMALLSGDFVFVGDLGRPDLLESAAGVVGAMEPSAKRLYQSARDFLALPEYLQIWPGHGAGSACGKALGAVPSTTVGYEKRFSPALRAVGAGERKFVDFILEGQPEPPAYFARMKRLNRDGASVLGATPALEQLSAERILELAQAGETVVVDARRDRCAFCEGHLPGSFAAPWNKAFPSTVGSFLEPEQPIALLIDEPWAADARRALQRIGYDRVVGWAPPSALAELPAGSLATLDRVVFDDELGARAAAAGGAILDVRGAAEATVTLDGAIQLAHTRVVRELDRLPVDRPLWVHCASGSRSLAAGSYLARLGRRVVFVDGDFRPPVASAVR